MKKEFWRYKKPGEMTLAEWEAICDACWRCWLHKLQDEDTLEVFYTWVACRYLDIDHCRCTAYPDRKTVNEACLHLTPEKLKTITWLPETSAYRLLYEGKPLPSWHLLVSGDVESVHTAGISLRGKAISGDCVASEELERYIIKRKL